MKKDVCGAIFFIALGSVYLVIASNYTAGTMVEPREGFFPIMIGGFMVLFGVWVLLAALKKKAANGSSGEMLHTIDLRKVHSAVMVLGCVSIYLVVLDTLGFLLSSPPLLFALTWIMGGKNLVVNGAIAVVATVVIYYVLWTLMRVPIPLGPVT